MSLIAKHMVEKEITSMSNIAIDSSNTPAAAAQPESENKSKIAGKAAKKPTKKGSAKEGEARRQEERRQSRGRPQQQEGREHRHDEAREGPTLAEIMEATDWQKHTVRGFVTILGKNGEHKVESPKTDKGSARTKSSSSTLRQPLVQCPPGHHAGAAFCFMWPERQRSSTSRTGHVTYRRFGVALTTAQRAATHV